jgi:RNA polymerase sigma factor (sigma-70 family)
MNNFTFIVKEARKKYDSDSLLSSEITSFINKVNKHIPTIVKDVIHLTQKYNLLDRESIEEIKTASKSSLKKLSEKYNISVDSLEDLWKMLKELKSNIRLLPQYMSSQEREMLELGKLSMDDLTIDLTSQNGRNAATKIYMPLIYKVVNQYINKSNLNKTDLISAALMGFTDAMNSWDRETGVPFKTYAGTRIRQQILNDINAHGHSLSGFNDYAFKKGYSADAVSIDGIVGDDDENRQDRLAALGFSDDEYSELDDEKMKPLFDLLEKNFSSRDVDIFYRFFTLKGNKKEKSKDIAKFYGMSEGNIRNSVINKILKFLRTNKQATRILQQLQESYNISMMCGMVGMNKNEILEALISDDIFILLEELNKWTDKTTFKQTIQNAFNQLGHSKSKYIISVLCGDFEDLDSTFKKNKNIIIEFLTQLYPTESFINQTDVTLLDYMVELQEVYKKHYNK